VCVWRRVRVRVPASAGSLPLASACGVVPTAEARRTLQSSVKQQLAGCRAPSDARAPVAGRVSSPAMIRRPRRPSGAPGQQLAGCRAPLDARAPAGVRRSILTESGERFAGFGLRRVSPRERIARFHGALGEEGRTAAWRSATPASTTPTAAQRLVVCAAGEGYAGMAATTDLGTALRLACGHWLLTVNTAILLP
jgi:hypothetical protein